MTQLDNIIQPSTFNTDKKQTDILKDATVQEYADYLKMMLFSHNYYTDHSNNSFKTILYTNTIHEDGKPNEVALDGWCLMQSELATKHNTNKIVLDTIIKYDLKIKKLLNELIKRENKFTNIEFSTKLWTQICLKYRLIRIRQQEEKIGKLFFNYIEYLKIL